MRRIVMNTLTLATVLIVICSLGALRAQAQQIVDAKLEASCTGYEGLQFTATGLAANTTYTALFTVTSVCPGSATPANNTISVTFTTPMTITGLPGGAPYTTGDFIQVGNPNCAQGPNPDGFCLDNPGLPTNTTSVQNFSTTEDINGPLAMNPNDKSTNDGCKVTATAILTANPSSVFTVPLEGLPSQTVVCNLTPTCLLTPGQTAIGGAPVSWNKFNAPSGSTVWIHAHIGTPSNLPTNQTTQIQFVGVTFTQGGQTYQLPDGFVNFDPNYSGSPTTVFSPGFAGVGAWVTTLNPNNLSDEIFFDGAAVPVNSSLESGGGSTFSYTTLSSDPSVHFNWQWSAAVFTFWPSDWNQADILAYHNSDHAGTPENKTVQQSLIQGPRGGGGSNFTGSWSGTGNGMCTNNF